MRTRRAAAGNAAIGRRVSHACDWPISRNAPITFRQLLVLRLFEIKRQPWPVGCRVHPLFPQSLSCTAGCRSDRGHQTFRRDRNRDGRAHVPRCFAAERRRLFFSRPVFRPRRRRRNPPEKDPVPVGLYVDNAAVSISRVPSRATAIMATIRIHQEDQENRIVTDLRGKENLAAAATGAVGTQAQVLHQTKRAVLGVLHNNCPRNGGAKPVRRIIYFSLLARIRENGRSVSEPHCRGVSFNLYRSRSSDKKPSQMRSRK